MTSTVQRGDDFRDTVVSMLEAAGFRAESETRHRFKKVDAVWQREDVDGTQTYLVEAKDYTGALPRSECLEFVSEYGVLVRGGEADRAWLISRGAIVPDGRSLVDAERGCKAMTFAEFQRRLFGIDAYLSDLLAGYESDRIDEWYVPPHTNEGVDLELHVRDWIDRPDALPLAVVAAYGRGKSTFARHLAASLAREALRDQACRVPVLVPLGDIVDEQSLEGLLGKVFTTGPGTRGYNFGLFTKLNQAGRFVVVFDGFDEMKHGMTLPRFESNIIELMRLDQGAAKLIVLGRDTALEDDVEFRSIILGRQRTAGGSEVAVRGRRPFDTVSVRDFTLSEARSFVSRYFPLAAADAHRGLPGAPGADWVEERAQELLSGRFDQLLARPVHAQMLCQIATDATLKLTGLSKHGLFDRFVHFLIDREVRKRGRDLRFRHEARRRFNASLALWLWRQGGVSNVSLAAVPNAICREASRDVSHDYDDTALRKELTAGCLIEKAAGTIFFGHRSLQEFLVAEALLRQAPEESNVDDMLGLVNPEIAAFVVDAARSAAECAATTAAWLGSFEGMRRTDLPPAAMRMFVELVASGAIDIPPDNRDPWFMWMRYFVLNGGLEYVPRTKSASDALPRLLGRASTPEGRAAAVVLGARAFREAPSTRHSDMVAWFASVLDHQAVREAVGKAQKCRSDEFVYVTRTKAPEFWAILQAARTSHAGGDATVDIDLDALIGKLSPLARTGIAEDANRFAADEDHRKVAVPLQALYRAWRLRDAELERVRPFFNDPDIRRKIRPLEVEVRPVRLGPSRQERGDAKPLAGEVSQPIKKRTLSLKRPAEKSYAR